MSALAMAAEESFRDMGPGEPGPAPDAPSPAEEFGWGAMRLSGLLAATADRHAARMAFQDQADRDEWSGRPRITWTYPFAYDIIRRLSLFFASLGLPARAPVGLCLPNGSEACLTLLALEQAGLTPCLMPAGWSEAELAAAVEAAGLQAVVTQGVIGEERPAEAFCRLAARYFGLRFVCAFGPLVPDGVVDLDRVILSTDAIDPDAVPTLDAAAGAGVVTFDRRDGAPRPVFRSCPSLIASAVTFLVPARIRAGERILSLLPPDDHRGLVTGLIASLLSGATLETIGLFTTAGFCAALLRDEPTHLVAPGWMEDILSRGGLPDCVASVILVHEAPVRFKARTGLKRPVVDVLALGEEALLTRARDPGGQFALSLDDEPGQGPGQELGREPGQEPGREPGQASVTTRNLLRVRRDPDGAIHLAGLAAETHAFEKGAPRAPSGAPGGWRACGYRADLFAGIVIGVS